MPQRYSVNEKGVNLKIPNPKPALRLTNNASYILPRFIPQTLAC
jgi:hypothetical protein